MAALPVIQATGQVARVVDFGSLKLTAISHTKPGSHQEVLDSKHARLVRPYIKLCGLIDRFFCVLTKQCLNLLFESRRVDNASVTTGNPALAINQHR